MESKLIVALFNTLQLVTLYFCIYGFTSTMPALPWYEPLTMGAYYMAFIMMFFQGFVVAYFLNMYKENRILKRNAILSLINLAILLIIVFIPDIFSEQLFYDLAYIAVPIEIALLILHVYISFVNIRKVV